MDATLNFMQQHDMLMLFCMTFLGLVLGSFFNVVISRLPQMLETEWKKECYLFLEKKPPEDAQLASINLCVPRSRCPNCQHPIAWFDNIPLLSFMLLKGCCRHCRHAISWQYPIVECISAGLFFITLWQLGFTYQSLAALILVSILIVQSGIDIKKTYIPDNITLPALWLGLILGYFNLFKPLEDCLFGAVFGYLSLWTIYWAFKLSTGKEGMGYGDFKLLAMLGAWLGWQYLPFIVIGSAIIGTICGIIILFMKQKGKDYPIPFGPYLAVAGWAALLWGDKINQAYLNYLLH